MDKENNISHAPQAENAQASMKSLGKMMQVLDCFDRESVQLKISEISDRCGLPKTTAQRIASSLRAIGLLEQNGRRDSYRLGLKLFQLGSTVLYSFDFHGRASPHIEKLQQITGENVHLCMFDGTGMVFVEKHSSNVASIDHVTTISSTPLYCNGVGKAFLAFQSEQLIERVIEAGLEPLTPHTIADPDEFRADLMATRERGYAIDDRESSMQEACVAAPIRNSAGHVFASISVSTSPDRLPVSRIAGISTIVIDVADEVSKKLGWDGK